MRNQQIGKANLATLVRIHELIGYIYFATAYFLQKSFQWNGIANKVMGQKWGQGLYKHNASRYNSASSNWLDAINEDSFTNEKVTEKSTSDKGKAIIEELNFESLPPLTRSPKVHCSQLLIDLFKTLKKIQFGHLSSFNLVTFLKQINHPFSTFSFYK